jgi:hypothetical protein
MKSLSFIVTSVYILGLALFLGSLLFLALANLVEAKWLDRLRSALLELSDLPYLLFPLFFVQLYFIPHLFPWAHSTGTPFLSMEKFAIRGIGLWVLWFIIRRAILKKTSFGSGPSLVLLLFSGTVAAIDNIMSIATPWSSTAFGLIFLLGAGILAFAYALVRTQSSRKNEDTSHGNIYLALVGTWAYLVFMQYLVAWSGNLPREAVWYEAHKGAFLRFVLGIVIVLQFLMPLPLLFFRSFKLNTAAMAWLSFSGAIAQILFVEWQLGIALPPGFSLSFFVAPVLFSLLFFRRRIL